MQMLNVTKVSNIKYAFECGISEGISLEPMASIIS